MNTQNFRNHYGSWAVITGASDGIGRAIAEQLAAAGLNLALIARRGNMLTELANNLMEQHDILTRTIVADLSESHAIEQVLNETGALDVGLFVAAAGFGTSGNFLDASLSQERTMIEVNITAVMQMTHAYAQRFVQKGRGGIILFSSLVAFQGVARAANYAATKAYIQTFAEGLSAELAPHGVDVIASAPGPVNSGFAARANMQMGAALTPDVVAKETLAALGTRTTVRPGLLSKFLEFSLSFLPRWGRVWAMSKVMGSMTNHQVNAAMR